MGPQTEFFIKFFVLLIGLGAIVFGIYSDNTVLFIAGWIILAIDILLVDQN